MIRLAASWRCQGGICRDVVHLGGPRAVGEAKHDDALQRILYGGPMESWTASHHGYK